MVDMSATLIHHGHIRLLRAARQYGQVIVALTTDQEILNKKGYVPELNFDFRREILEAIRYVDQVVPSPWMIQEDFLDKHQIDLLVHGSDNKNLISCDRLLILPRTKDISSTILRMNALNSLKLISKKQK